MEYTVVIIILIVIFGLLTIRRIVVFEHQRGLLYNRGKFSKLLQPGEHWLFSPFHTVNKVDVRTANVTIPGQELLSSDNIGIKISLAASYRISDPYIALNKVSNYQEALYLLLQLNLRDLIGSLAVDELLANRVEIGKQLFENSVVRAAAIGIELLLVNIKDIMFPGELKNIFAQVVNARKEGLAALERARGESAALRNLANAASMLDNNPNLMQLRLFQVLEKNNGNTIVIMPSESNLVSKLITKEPRKINE